MVAAFDPALEQWDEYTECLQHYFMANDIVAEAKQRAIFLNAVNPKPSPIVKRYKFNTRRQGEGESVSTYVAELRKIAEHCEYGTVLSDMLRDRLVCGISNKAVQRRLLHTPAARCFQWQANGNDCGLFALANATALCNGTDPC